MIEISLGFKSLSNRNINAGFGFQSNLDFTSNPEFYTLKYGYDEIPKRLCKRITNNGVKVNLLSELVKLDEDVGQSFPIRIEYIDRNDPNKSQQKTIRCKRCVLALPKLALQTLPSSNEWMADTKFSRYVDSVISESLTKINLYFEKQWWSILGIDSGPNYTDLQLGSVYIFTPIREPTERGKAYEDPGSLTIYCDYDNSYYWQSMQSIGKDYQPKDNVKVSLHSVLAKEQVVVVAMDQLAQLFQRSNFKKGSPRDVTPWNHSLIFLIQF
ncbi:hypothetical protein LOD99_6658 [Oopsacas minuta]|uniref:Amine oxidase domain-containing protein n=1 Tax=Oopsacas minuta TaxID=111878 RepID=A0AAV7JMA7_9METZ|nr:hypothetical protein LOD99_6658 [Oopsacas minuta]